MVFQVTQNACEVLDEVPAGNYIRDSAKDSAIQIRASEQIKADSSSQSSTHTPA
jgi:hypothetical protein